MADADKLMGFMPKDKYVKISYALILGGCALGALIAVLALVGVVLPFGGIAMLLGVAGLVLALLGVFMFKAEFSALDQNHLIYIAVAYAVFFITAQILLSALAVNFTLVFLVAILLNAFGLLLFFTGFNSWSHGRTITKDNIKSEIQLATKRA